MSNLLTPASPMTLQSAATTGTGGVLYLAGECERVTFILTSASTTTGGAISLEEGYFNRNSSTGQEPDYSGTWSVLQSVSASSFTGGAQVAVHVAGSMWAVRARISSAITGGGTVSVVAYGN